MDSYTAANYAAGAAPTPSFPGPPDPRLDGPATTAAAVSTPFAGTDIRSMKTAAEFSLREYMTLQQRRQPGDPVGEERVRRQAGIVLSDLQTLRGEVAVLVKRAEAHRWRKWLVGGVVASLIPLVRKLFRRKSSSSSSSDHAATTDTEHAFRRSQSLIARILGSVRRGAGAGGRLAAVAAFVLAVLYVFTAEVSLRVARTVSRRLRRLSARVERGAGGGGGSGGGDDGLREDDLRVLDGWRWRVLLW
ncbi:hypothetical protein GGR56DRAFT_166225 [Xylariaceae sp. FL0804]|nr:hypothetical protein GGR56DRAFT_166225 [Xylariaceae sp. FL0804]